MSPPVASSTSSRTVSAAVVTPARLTVNTAGEPSVTVEPPAPFGAMDTSGRSSSVIVTAAWSPLESMLYALFDLTLTVTELFGSSSMSPVVVTEYSAEALPMGITTRLLPSCPESTMSPSEASATLS